MIEIKLRFNKNDIKIAYDDPTGKFSGTLNFASLKDGKLKIQSKFFNHRVHDKCRYFLCKKDNVWNVTYPDGTNISDFTHKNDIAISTEENKNIVLVLESPHKSEFTITNKQLRPISPAVGNAGIYLNEFLTSHVLPILDSLGMEIENEREYNLCIVNPVQYQTSLHHINLKGIDTDLRNDVWRKLYPHCRENFKKRLEKYKPVVILNGCTSQLKEDVTPVLKSFSEAQHFSVHHPTNWQLYLGGFKKTDY